MALSRSKQGDVIGWGKSNKDADVKRTLTRTKTLKSQDVRAMMDQGLTRKDAEALLALYEKAIKAGGKKLDNAQLIPRRDLMKKILSLWPS